jgi:hypothetical protein
MGKGIVKTTGIPSGTTVQTTVTTVVATGATATSASQYDGTDPAGQVITGTLDDNSNPAVTYNFMQPYGAELGLAVGVKVNFNFITVNGQPIATTVTLLEKGVIESINATNDGGTLKDRALKTSIPFAQLYCKETLLVVGSVVSYDKVIDPNTAGVVATALVLIK